MAPAWRESSCWCGFGLFARGYIGGGDAKLLAAAGCGSGGARCCRSSLVTTLAGGALAILYKLWQLVRADCEVRDVVWLRRVFGPTCSSPTASRSRPERLWVYSGTWWMARLM
jgi:prepilin peptidase CpaA